jgi:hypothetical protein
LFQIVFSLALLAVLSLQIQALSQASVVSAAHEAVADAGLSFLGYRLSPVWLVSNPAKEGGEKIEL